MHPQFIATRILTLAKKQIETSLKSESDVEMTISNILLYEQIKIYSLPGKC